MSNQNDTQIAHDEFHGARQRRDDNGAAPSFGLRAAILAGLVVATAGGAVAAQGISDDPVRMVTEAHSTCCPPDILPDTL